MASENPVKIGLVGCGRLAAEVHLPALAGLEEARVTCLAESDPERRLVLGRRFPKFPVVKSSEELLERADVEAVVICTPRGTHESLALQALANQKHLYLEKPLATTLEGGLRIIEAQKRSSTRAALGFNFRHRRELVLLRGWLRAEPALSFQHLFVQPGTGNVLEELACHSVDTLRFLTGQEVLWVQAWEDDELSLLQLATEGCRGQITVTRSGAPRDRWELQGASTNYSFDRHQWRLSRTPRIQRDDSFFGRARRGLEVVRETPERVLNAMRSAFEPSYSRCLQEFCRLVRGQTVDLADLVDGYRALEVVEAARESSRTGRRIEVKRSIFD